MSIVESASLQHSGYGEYREAREIILMRIRQAHSEADRGGAAWRVVQGQGDNLASFLGPKSDY